MKVLFLNSNRRTSPAADRGRGGTPPAVPATYSDSPERNAPKGSSAFFPHADKSRATPAGGYGKANVFRPKQGRPAASVTGEGA